MVFRKDYPALDVSRARVVLVEMQDHLLGPVHRAEPPPRPRHPASRGRRGAPRRRGRVGRRPTRSTLRRRRGAAVPDARLGGRRAGQPAGRRARASTRGRAVASTVAPDLQHPRPARRVGHRRHRRRPRPARRRSCRSWRPVAMQVGRHVARQIARLLRRQAHRAVPLPRQGHDGHHRSAGCGGRAARRASGCVAGWPGWPGSGCTSCSWSASATGCRCSSTGRGTTSPGIAGPRLILRPRSRQAPDAPASRSGAAHIGRLAPRLGSWPG